MGLVHHSDDFGAETSESKNGPAVIRRAFPSAMRAGRVGVRPDAKRPRQLGMVLAAVALASSSACSTPADLGSAEVTANTFARAAAIGDAEAVCDLQVSATGGHRIERDSTEWSQCFDVVAARAQTLISNINWREKPVVVEREAEVRYSWGIVKIGVSNFHGDWLIGYMDLG